jgi:hypothetical protein
MMRVSNSVTETKSEREVLVISISSKSSPTLHISLSK